MDILTLYGASAVTVMLIAYALERRSPWWIFIFAIACAGSSLYGFLAGTWPFGVVEGIWGYCGATPLAASTQYRIGTPELDYLPQKPPMFHSPQRRAGMPLCVSHYALCF